MRAIFTKVFGDLRRRLVQTIVVASIVALATGVGTLALALINASSAPYDNAFAQNAGAHLAVTFDSTHVTANQLVTTAQLPDVTKTAGPWPVTILDVAYGSAKTHLLTIGRPSATAPLDHLQIVAGRWVAGPREIVLTRSFAQLANLHVGDHILSLNRSDTPQLTVVGEAVDIDEGSASLFDPQFAWVMPDQVAKLLPDTVNTGFMMLYRFRHAATQADLDRDTQALTSALPQGSIEATITHLTIQQIFNLNSSLILSFFLAFAAFALGAVVIIVVNIVAGAVLASVRDIGITRALGFTPGQAVL
ncbi:MAG TPA: hypothetical protein VKB76_03650, partial [Ktedonobacterales bacterium]|nr:hypothetical protein [Ktedonobacterales bacterium]